MSKKHTCSATTTKSNVIDPVSVMFHGQHVWILNKPHFTLIHMHTPV